MELSRIRKWLFISTLTWLATVLALGGWWVYLAMKLANTLEDNDLSHLFGPNIHRMLKWEGSFFIVVLIIISASVFYLYLQELKRSQAIQTFFASLSHELKTPLANIRLQSQFINELIEPQDPKVQKSIQHLVKGSYELEEQFDNMLQLSRIELGDNLNLENIDLKRFLAKMIETNPYQDININLICDNASYEVSADQFALKTVFKNLIENTKRHNKEENKTVSISLKNLDSLVSMSYQDNGSSFSGELEKLGKLFYKHQSHQGSGIGIYIIKKLTQKMNGLFKIKQNSKNELLFNFSFPRVQC